MEHLLNQLYACEVLELGTPGEDFGTYSAIQFGVLIRADSLALLISALGEAHTHRALPVAA